jgi:sterol desaturase/sphingolipid hydroxylase (fatty acid hydroxylase superfamily)
MLMKATPESPRMFESDLIDLFSRTHFSIVPILYIPASIALCWYSVATVGVGLGTTLALWALGFVGWSLTEYWLHRLFFHWEPKFKWGPRMHFLVHGVHHTWPRDKYRLVMPPAVSISLFIVFGALFLFLFGNYGWAVHAGFTFGYMYYDVTHYYLHHASPRTEYGRRLKKNHMLHHFKESNERFGVSMKLWDYVFGTVNKAEWSKDSPAAQPEPAP